MRIAISTGGGDAPGLNAAIYGVTMAADRRGWEVLGIHAGYAGLVDPSRITVLNPRRVAGIVPHGGTILGTTNRGDPFHYPVVDPSSGQTQYEDVSDRVLANFRKLGLDALVAVGGDGSMQLAHRLSLKGLPVIGVPKTIDNDLSATMATFGFDTAVSTATEAIDKLHSTASAHERVLVVEVMGRNAGWIALHSGLSGSADVILLPEIPFAIARVCQHLSDNDARGKRYGIVVAAEGAQPLGSTPLTREEQLPGRQEPLLGGVAEHVATEITRRIGKETRSLVLGHLQRGGSPTTFDRLVAQRFGAAAVRLIAEGRRDVMVAFHPPEMIAVPLADAVAGIKRVPLEGDTVLTCRDLGISFGD
ncbi:MAG: ATP-dependent 6-phosphofructokinase [Myxococcaceae bacterium]